jgi:hypothetical protein
MIRRMLGDQLEAVAAGRDPIGVSFDQGAPTGGFRSRQLYPRSLNGRQNAPFPPSGAITARSRSCLQRGSSDRLG